MPSKLIDPESLPTMSFDWGLIKPLVASDNTDGTDVSLMHVVLLPGEGHERHNHPDSDEILYILAGRGEQMVDDADTFAVAPGQAVLSRRAPSTRRSTPAGSRSCCWRSTHRPGPRRRSRACRTTARCGRARRSRLVRG